MITVVQKFDSTELTSDAKGKPYELTVHLTVDGCADEAEALSAAYDFCSASLYGIPRREASVKGHVAENRWEVDVAYSRSSASFQSHLGDEDEEEGGTGDKPISTSGGDEYTFSLTSGTEHIETPLKHFAKYPSDAVHPGAIGTSADGTITGCDRFTSQVKFSRTKRVKASYFNANLKVKIIRFHKCVNSNAFWGYEPGEVMFNGIDSRQVDDNYWEVTYNFTVRLNERNVKIGDFTIPLKRGWDIAWTKTSRKIQDCHYVTHIDEVFIDEIYEYKNFSLMP